MVPHCTAPHHATGPVDESVLPKSVASEIVTLSSKSFGSRHVKVFGGQEIVLNCPISLEVTICGLQMTHPFFYVDAEIPAISRH